MSSLLRPMTVAASGQSYASTVLADTPLAYYRLDETSGTTAADSSGHGSNATYSSGITYSASGALLNDSDTAVTLGSTSTVTDASLSSLTGSQASTTEFWFKVPSSAYNSGTIDAVSDASVYTEFENGGTTLLVGPNFNGAHTFGLPYPVNDGQWHLFDVTSDGGTTCTVYMDGSALGTEGGYNNCGGNGSHAPVFSIGNWNGDTTAGSFDEVAVYPSQLSATRIAARWTLGATQLNQTTLCPTTPTSPYASDVLSDHPDAYLRLNELASKPTQRVAFDSSGLCTTASPTNGAYPPSSVSSTSGGLANDADPAVTLAAGTPSIRDTASTLPAWNQPSTTEFWYKVPSSVYSSGSIDLVTDPSGYLQLQNGGTTLLVGPNFNGPHAFGLPYPVNDGQWHLFDVANDGGTNCTVYMDGSMLGTQGGYNNCGGNTSYGPGLIIGNYAGGDTTAGSFDEVAVYPGQLAATRISDHWTRGATQLNQSTLCPAAPTSAYSQAVLSDSPGTYLRLDELSSEPTRRVVFDSSGHCTTANPTNGTYPPSSVVSTPGARTSDADPGVALQSAQSNIRDTASQLPAYNQPSTTEFWFKVSSAAYSSGTLDLVTDPTNYLQLQNGGTTLVVGPGYFSNHTFSLSQAVNDGQWHLFDAEGDGGNYCTVFVDAINLGTQGGYNNCGPYYSGDNPYGPGLVIGNFSGGTDTTAGSFDEVAVYSSQLSAARVAAHYSAGAPVGGPVTAAQSAGGGSNYCFPCHGDQIRHGNITSFPIDTATGNFWHVFDDVDIPGRGLPLNIIRTYNSTSASTNGPLGYGWQLNQGMSLSLSGTSPNEVATITQDNGSQVTFNQPATGTSWPPSAPRFIASLTQNADGTWTFVRQAQDTFTFSAAGQLTRAVDRNGYATTYSYTGSALTGITDSAGRSLTMGWTGSLITSVTDANVTPSRSVTYQYNDGNGNLTDVFDVNGNHWQFTYDTSHRLTVMKDPNCLAAVPACPGVVNVYDSQGRVATQTDQLGHTTTFDYTSIAGATKVTDSSVPAHVSVDYYNQGLRVATTQGYGTPQAATTTFGYDPATLALTSTTDPNGNTTTYSVDSNGNVLSTLDPMGRTTSATYNAFNEPLTQTDGLLVTTQYAYDANGNLKQVSRPLKSSTGTVLATQVTQYQYNDSAHPGDMTLMIDPNNKNWQYAYDAFGDLNSVKDPLLNQTTTFYNADGWKTSSVSPRGNVSGCGCASQYTTTYGYVDSSSGLTNEDGLVATVTDPLGHTTKNHYDADRNLTSTQDPDGNPPTSYKYDLANEPTQTIRADQTMRQTDYNPDGTVLDQKDGKTNAITTFGYDTLGRVTTTKDALLNVTTYTYDGAGNRLTQQDPGGNCTATPATGCTTRGYDADNELTSVTYSDSVTPNISNIGYDADGKRTSMSDGTGTSSWVYDSLHRLTSYTNGANAVVGYDYLAPSLAGGYDLKYQVRHIAYPNSVGTVTRGYDDAGRLSSVQDWLGNPSSFGYDQDSNLTTKQLPASTGIVDTAGFNAAGQLTSISDVKGGSTTLFSATYGRDSNGQVSSDTSVPSTVGSDHYSALNQLCYAGSSNTSACSSPPSGSQGYGFDAADNLTSNKGTTQAFNAADQLCWTVSGSSGNPCGTVPTSATQYRYDTRGNRTLVTPPSGSPTNLGYDQANRLSSWGVGSTTTATYAYNGDGLRMSKTVSGVTTPFTWDVSGTIPRLISDGTSQYVYGPGGLPLEQITSRPAISLVGSPVSTSGKATSLTLTLPSGVQANDQVFVASTQPSTTTVTAATGYSSVTSVTSGGSSPLATTTVFRHTVAAGDTSVTLTYSSRQTAQAMALVVYRGIDPTTPVDVFQSAYSTSATTTVTAPSVSPSFANDELLVVQGATGSFSSSSWTAPSAMTERIQNNATRTVSVGIADQGLTASGATGTRTSTLSTTGNLDTVILAAPQPPTVLYYHQDQLGSTRLLTDGAGAVRGTSTYDPYGNLTSSTGSYTTPLGYAGQYTDAETGFLYLRARYYDPATAQFLSRDPMAATTRSPYGYVGGNPINGTDPSGLWCPATPSDCVPQFVKDAAGAAASQATSWAGDIKNQAESWAGDVHDALPNCTIFSGNCAPYIKSASVCVGGGVFGGIGILGNVCVGQTNGFKHGGLTYSAGYGFGLGAGASGGIAISNADCPKDYAGPFAEAGGGAGLGAGSFQFGQGSKGQPIGVGYGGLGMGTPEGFVGANNTGVWQWW